MKRERPLVGAGAVQRLALPAWLERIVSVGIVTANPEIARRQRITNVAAFATAANALSHCLLNALHNFQGLALVNLYNVLIALAALLLPRLHRFGENVAAVVLVCMIIAGQIFVVFALGIASDLHIYLTLAGAMLLFFGVENRALFLVFFTLATVVLLLLLNYAPVDGFVLPQDGMLRDMLSSHAMLNTIIINAAIMFYALTLLRRAELELKDAHERSETLVDAILPAPVAERLKGGEHRIADRIENLSVMFADLAGFTPASRDCDPAEVVDYLDGLVRDFEALCTLHGAEKIKTVGDSCMAVAGLNGDAQAGAVAIGGLALAMIEKNAARAPLGGRKLPLRVGVHSGTAMAGIIGGTRFSYDVWGDAINIASRMESAGEEDRVQASEAFRDLAADAFRFEPRGVIDVKGVGETRTYFLIAPR